MSVSVRFFVSQMSKLESRNLCFLYLSFIISFILGSVIAIVIGVIIVDAIGRSVKLTQDFSTDELAPALRLIFVVTGTVLAIVHLVVSTM